MSTASPSRQRFSIAGIDHDLVKTYFQTLNDQDFKATAHLFAQEGELHATRRTGCR